MDPVELARIWNRAQAAKAGLRSTAAGQMAFDVEALCTEIDRLKKLLSVKGKPK